jgi:hypothetical protein
VSCSAMASPFGPWSQALIAPAACRRQAPGISMKPGGEGGFQAARLQGPLGPPCAAEPDYSDTQNEFLFGWGQFLPPDLFRLWTRGSYLTGSCGKAVCLDADRYPSLTLLFW